MRIALLFRQYIWLVNIINRHNGITFAELQRAWLQSELSEGQPLSRTTFNRHKDAIEEIFGILIVCSKTDGYRYRICNRQVLEDDTMQNWMLSTLSVNQLLQESKSLHERILIEPILVDDDTLHTVIHAMKDGQLLRIIYQKYSNDDAKEHEVAPYCIKLFRQRWYMLGRFSDGFLAVFAIDRIVSARIMAEKFVIEPHFNANSYFKEYFGVLTDDRCPLDEIVLRVSGYERHYIYNLPIHPSQRLISTNEEWDEYEYTLRITPDFISHLLSMGKCVHVIRPAWLAKEMEREHRAAARLYKRKIKAEE